MTSTPREPSFNLWGKPNTRTAPAPKQPLFNVWGATRTRPAAVEDFEGHPAPEHMGPQFRGKKTSTG
jgi:hypothetical protein